MNVDKGFNILALIVGLAIVATLVQSKETVKIVRGFGDAFTGSIRAAKAR